ncbi:hypothetical protein [Neisseria sp. GT4A_CT1]|nr:hypothetical protein [Neisseria sp. GT4A_CT1]
MGFTLENKGRLKISAPRSVGFARENKGRLKIAQPRSVGLAHGKQKVV